MLEMKHYLPLVIGVVFWLKNCKLPGSLRQYSGIQTVEVKRYSALQCLLCENTSFQEGGVECFYLNSRGTMKVEVGCVHSTECPFFLTNYDWGTVVGLSF